MDEQAELKAQMAALEGRLNQYHTRLEQLESIVEYVIQHQPPEDEQSATGFGSYLQGLIKK